MAYYYLRKYMDGLDLLRTRKLQGRKEVTAHHTTEIQYKLKNNYDSTTNRYWE